MRTRTEEFLYSIILEFTLWLAIAWSGLFWCLTKLYNLAKRLDEKVDAYVQNNFPDERFK
jgi:hypothetical protein